MLEFIPHLLQLPHQLCTKHCLILVILRGWKTTCYINFLEKQGILKKKWVKNKQKTPKKTTTKKQSWSNYTELLTSRDSSRGIWCLQKGAWFSFCYGFEFFGGISMGNTSKEKAHTFLRLINLRNNSEAFFILGPYLLWPLGTWEIFRLIHTVSDQRSV